MRLSSSKRSTFLISLVLLLCVAQVTQAAPTKIVFWFRQLTDLQTQTFNAWKAGFEEKNPDITVEWEIPPGDWQTKLPILVASGMGPDVYEQWGTPGREWGINGVSLDLTPYVKRDFTAKDIQDFYPASWQATEIQYGPKKGVRYGLPSNGNIFLMYYNKDMFAQNGVEGLEALDKKGLWTWDSMVNIGKKFVRSDGDKVTKWFLDSDDLYATTSRGAGWLHAAGGNLFDLPYNPNTFIGNKPEAIKALTFMVDLIWEHQIMAPLNIRAQARWVQQNSAILMWQGSASMADLEKSVTTFDWDLGPKPMGPKSRGYIVSADMFGINSASKNKDAAWRFLKYLTSTEGQQIYSKIVGRAPTRRSAFPYFQTLFPKRSTICQTLGMMEGQISPDTFMSVDVNNLLSKTIREQVATKSKNVQQAMDEIATALEAMTQK